MDKHELARRLARVSRRSRGRAADEIDALVYTLVKQTKPNKDSEDQPSKASSSASREK